MDRDPDGRLQIGDDGVLRSFAYNGTVLGHVKLTKNQLMKVAEEQTDGDFKAHLHEVW